MSCQHFHETFSRYRLARSAILPGLLLLITAPIAADTLILKNGREAHGRIESVDRNTVFLKIPTGRIGYRLEEISEIRSGEGEPQIDSLPMAVRKEHPAARPKLQSISNSPSKLSSEDQERLNSLIGEMIALNDEPEYSGFNKDRQTVAKNIGSFGKAAVPEIYRAYAHADEETQPYLLAALFEADPTTAAVVAEDALADNLNSDVREIGVRMLSRHAAQNAEIIAGALGDELGNVRLAAVEGLAESKNTKYLPQLRATLEQDLPHIQEAALNAIRELIGMPFQSREEALSWLEANPIPSGDRDVP